MSTQKTPIMRQDSDEALVNGICSLWQQGLIQDFNIQIDGRDFPINKAVLASVSRTFQGILAKKNANPNHVTIDGVSADALTTLILFIHTNKMELVEATVVDVLAAAVYLQIESAVSICTKFMVANLNINNWYHVMTVFRSHKLTYATEQVLKYMKNNMREIVKTLNNHKLPHSDLQFFLENWQSSENDLFQFIVEWVNADVTNRKQYQDEMLCSVRYCLMSVAELAAIKEMKVFRKSPNPWRRLITKALKYLKLPINQRVLDTSEQTKIRSPPSYVIFSKAQCETGGSYYEPLKDKCFIQREVLKLPLGIGKYPDELAVNNFLVAGTDRRWAIFDTRTLQWSRIANIPRKLTCEALTHDNKFLYAVGGQWYKRFYIDRMCDLFDTVVERYDFKTNTWRMLKKLPVDVRTCDACIIDNQLYVCGGRGSPGLLCLDLATKKWTYKAHLLRMHEFCTAHVMRVFGEESICLFDQACNMEYYAPSTDQWTRCTFSFNTQSLLRKWNIWGKNRHEKSWGNMLFISDVKGEVGENTCAVVRFPEEGIEAEVDSIHQYTGDRLATFFTLLSVAPHTGLPHV